MADDTEENLSPDDWYEVVSQRELLQCDLLPNLTVPVIVTPAEGDEGDADAAVSAEIAYDEFTFDAIVLTQSCDLANKKVLSAVVAQYVDWIKIAAQEGYTNAEKRRRQQERIRKHSVPHYALLAERPGTPGLPWSTVDFRQLFTVPVAYIEDRAVEVGERLRLRAPYRERISQAFGSYFSRVAVPEERRDFDRWNPSGEIRSQ